MNYVKVISEEWGNSNLLSLCNSWGFFSQVWIYSSWHSKGHNRQP